LVALGDDSRWVLAPQAVVQECQGEEWQPLIKGWGFSY
jgi:hypothetical protein